VVTDWGYLRFQRNWRQRVVDSAPCPVATVETETVIPVETVSGKEEYAAATIRPKIGRRLADFLVDLPLPDISRRTAEQKMPGLSLRKDPADLLASLRIDRSVGPVPAFRGGASHARLRLDTFIARHLKDYHRLRSDPGLDISSQLSPYLHFGQVSPLEIALCIGKAPGIPVEAKQVYLEELIVRRELSMNFVHFNERYDRFDALPAWAQKTLAKHAGDPRPYLYARKALEEGQTHDPYWNAAQREMILTGKMHNYMRMYWGKKIIEWSGTPEEAWQTALYLNNRYQLDGRDANSFAGVAWCFGKHDRPWAERPVFGTIRYMNSAGLARKFNMKRYLDRVAGG